MSKERNYKFETLQLHVGQEIAIMQQLVSDLQMQVTSTED